MATRDEGHDSSLDPECYGSPEHVYRGHGDVTLSDGTQVPCRFSAAQYPSGRIVILISAGEDAVFQDFCTCTAFRGVSTEGYTLETTGHLHNMNHLPELPRNAPQGVWAALDVDQLNVVMNPGVSPSIIKLGLTNVALPASPVRPPLAVPYASLMRISNYSEVWARLQVLKDIQITGELCCEVGPNGPSETLWESIRALCHVLSVVNGSCVQWVLADCLDCQGQVAKRIHRAAITKNYGAWHLIPAVAPDEYQTFLDVALPAYTAKRDAYGLGIGAIDAYLDAKAEADYLELRGAKLAVAMERLRTAFIKAPGSTLAIHIIAEPRFAELSDNLRIAICSALGNDLRIADKKAIIAKVPSLNRRSFSNHLRGILRQLGIEIPQSEQRLFIACRNKLVHEGEFYCRAASASDRAEVEPLASPFLEYCFLIHFLDRIFLALLEYRGAYYDWSVGGPPRENRLAYKEVIERPTT